MGNVKEKEFQRNRIQAAALEIANHMEFASRREFLYIGDSKTDMETGQNAKNGYDRCSMGISRSRGVKRDIMLHIL